MDDMDLLFKKAENLELKSEIASAILIYTELAGKNYVKAIEKLVIIYYEGILIDKDIAKYKKWLYRGMACESTFCIFNYAVECYKSGNVERAINYFIRSADDGDSSSQVLLAKYYYEEKHDLDTSLFWLKKAVALQDQNAIAYYQYLERKLEEDLKKHLEIREIEKQKEEALKRLKREELLRKRLSSSFTDVVDIFTEKMLNNKVHFYRG